MNRLNTGYVCLFPMKEEQQKQVVFPLFALNGCLARLTYHEFHIAVPETGVYIAVWG